jgi:hypothetical protein
MQATKRYMKDVSKNMARALSSMPQAPNGKRIPLPGTIQEITQYVDELLTQDEQVIHDGEKD